MISATIHRRDDDRLLERVHGETMAQAIKDAKRRAYYHARAIDTDVTIRDCLGGLRGIIGLRDGQMWGHTS